MTALDRVVSTIRVDAADKVTGRARYAFEHHPEDVCVVVPVTSTIAKGRLTAVHADDARALAGVVSVISHVDGPRLTPVGAPELLLLQDDRISYTGQIVAAVVAESLEVAVHAASLVRVDEIVEAHDVTLRPDHPALYAPDFVNPRYATDSRIGDIDSALGVAAVTIDQLYTTPLQHNHPMEPHASLATWSGDDLTVVDSTQGMTRTRDALAGLFGIERAHVRVIAQFVGGGFGAKGQPRANVVLAALAARVVGRPVKCALTRDEMVAVGGHRTPTISRVRLGAQGDGTLTAIGHDVFEQSSTLVEFAEQTAVATRHMYAAPHRLTTHRLVRLDVPTPSWMRAPGECPGMFALESAMDELAEACGIDPIELRIKNEPSVHPETGVPFSTRNLVTCLHDGAERFGWAGRNPVPGSTRDGRWLVGSGVASATYPARVMPTRASAFVEPDGRLHVRICAVDIGTGARTALALLAADEFGVEPSDVDLQIADTDYGDAMGAGGSMGTTSWGWAVTKACRELKAEHERIGYRIPPDGIRVDVDTAGDVAALPDLARYAYGAHFAEVRVDPDTGEVHVKRMLGVFAVGRVLSPVTARSQLIGGMTMGISMALHEESSMDPRFGDMTNRDLAGYHVASCADVHELDAFWLDEHEPNLGPVGAKGLGEIGIVGAAAAIANAVHHATGRRVRDLPIRPGWLFD